MALWLLKLKAAKIALFTRAKGQVMKVNVTKANHHYINKDGVMAKVELGEHDLPDNVAKAMIASGKAKEVSNPKPNTKK